MASNIDDSLLDIDTIEKLQGILLKRLKKNAPDHIAIALSLNNIPIDQPKEGEYRISAIISKDNYKGVKGIPDARAQEFGSGEHNTTNFQSPMQKKYGTGPQGKIRITPKKKTFLAFPWENADTEALKWSRIAHWKRMKEEGTIISEVGLPSYAGYFGGRDREGNPQDILLFNYVDHPGIPPYKGKGYIRVSFREAKETLLSEVGENAVKNLREKIRTVFSRPGGKNK